MQDDIRTEVNAVLGECIWNLSYSERRMAIELELTVTLDDDAISNLCCQFPIPADYDGLGSRGSKFVFYNLYEDGDTGHREHTDGCTDSNGNNELHGTGTHRTLTLR